MFRQTYPKNKIEWIIVDDGKDKINDLLPEEEGMIIKYIYLDKPLILGMKRNFCVKTLQLVLLGILDDDDIHFPKSIEFRVRALLGCKLSNNPELKKCEILGSLDMLIYYLNQEQFRYGMCRKNHLYMRVL